MIVLASRHFQVTDIQRAAKIAMKLNNRPKKYQGYKPPAEVLGLVLRL